MIIFLIFIVIFCIPFIIPFDEDAKFFAGIGLAIHLMFFMFLGIATTEESLTQTQEVCVESQQEESIETQDNGGHSMAGFGLAIFVMVLFLFIGTVAPKFSKYRKLYKGFQKFEKKRREEKRNKREEQLAKRIAALLKRGE